MGKKDKNGNPITPENWTKMIRSTMECDAWRALSPKAQALYPWLKLEWKGPKNNNNGAIQLSVDQAASKMGVSRNTASKAFHELQAKGFIIVSEPGCLGVEGIAKAPKYEITELAMPTANAREGRKLYLSWSQGNDFEVVSPKSNNPTGRNGKTKTRPTFEDDAIIEFRTKQAFPS